MKFENIKQNGFLTFLLPEHKLTWLQYTFLDFVTCNYLVLDKIL